MSRIFVDMPAANVVGAGKKSTFRLPIGLRYHSLVLATTNFANGASDIVEIALKLGNEVIHRYSGTLRDTFNKHDGLSAMTSGDSFLQIPLDRPNLLNRASQEETALNTGVAGPRGEIINSMTLEVTLGAGVGATAGMELFAEQSEPIVEARDPVTEEMVPAGPGAILRILPETLTVAGTGEKQFHIPDIGNNSRKYLNRAWFVTGNISQLEVQRDRNTVFDRTAALNTDRLTAGKKVPQSGLFVFDRTEHGFGGDMLDLRGVKDFRYIAQMAAAGDIDMYAEYVGTLTV